MSETKATTIRLTDEARANAERIIRTGAAADISGAIHVALALAPLAIERGFKRPPKTKR